MGDIHADNETSRITDLLLKHFGLRVRPEMGQFILKRMSSSPDASIPVIGGDSRTGVAVRQLLAARDLRDAMNSAGNSTLT